MLDLILSRRTIRKYQKYQVEQEKVDKLIAAALSSPSGRNTKSRELLVIDDKDLLEKLGATRGTASKPISNAPLAMVILADAEITDTWIEDAAIMATIVQVTAHSLGLGSCWVQVRERFTTDGQSVDSFVKDLLNIPDKYQVSAIISIGYPAEDKDAYTKDKLDYNKVHHNKF